MHDYDLAIIGGGLVGASLAVALAETGLRIAVVEATEANAPAHPSYDERMIALSLGSARIFQGMGLWSAIEPDAAPIQHVHVSDRGHFGFAHLDAEDEGVPALGYVAPARVMGAALSKRLETSARISLLRPARLQGLQITKDRVSLEVAVAGQSQLLTAGLLVAADGGESSVRKRLGLKVRAHDYGYDAIIATVTPERVPATTRPGTAFERFTDTGPMALLPMTEGRYGVVWTARQADTAGILGLSDADFIDALQMRFGARLGELTRPSRRIAYPLRLMLASQLTRERLLLIGNAAHTLHPVAGQGFNLGLRDVAELADLLVDAQRTAQDIGGPAVLGPYRRRRAPEHALIAGLTDGLARLFVNSWGPVRAGRNLGLLGLDLLPPARHHLARRFMGAIGPQPRLARGLPAESALPPAPATATKPLLIVDPVNDRPSES
ncbi:2-octaprenyl-6-methoxyphenyl hydroxylase [Lamprobacter modestohalophilus]|uniref:2-octaprenyl-6-methoxyphenyl hydroxylase n=1 Tax=Lamprobacter modestohalophilus TaxID=1064514 RepID=A0A9X1B331_9GAMM|nr:2-octaprenyl-6-methoxyphenyl hydroxylase [Lamprobacter modestohalophilus]MBK1617251.1 2-octaprenyl-6-methoxyphenyl hydroxylase [Lamprobacter modestohalophilus]